MTQLIEPTMRPLTTDDYIIAAKIVASCPKDRLAIVTGLLKNGGFVVNYSRDLISPQLNSASVVCQLRDVKEKYDLTWGFLSEKMNIPKDVLRAYSSGKRVPSQDRCDELLCKLCSIEEELDKGEQE